MPHSDRSIGFQLAWMSQLWNKAPPTLNCTEENYRKKENSSKIIKRIKIITFFLLHSAIKSLQKRQIKWIQVWNIIKLWQYFELIKYIDWYIHLSAFLFKTNLLIYLVRRFCFFLIYINLLKDETYLSFQTTFSSRGHFADILFVY